MEKNAMDLLVEYSNQDNQKEENEKVYTAYKTLCETTQAESCCVTLGALCCCGI